MKTLMNAKQVFILATRTLSVSMKLEDINAFVRRAMNYVKVEGLASKKVRLLYIFLKILFAYLCVISDKRPLLLLHSLLNYII